MSLGIGNVPASFGGLLILGILLSGGMPSFPC